MISSAALSAKRSRHVVAEQGPSGGHALRGDALGISRIDLSTVGAGQRAHDVRRARRARQPERPVRELGEALGLDDEVDASGIERMHHGRRALQRLHRSVPSTLHGEGEAEGNGPFGAPRIQAAEMNKDLVHRQMRQVSRHVGLLGAGDVGRVRQ